MGEAAATPATPRTSRRAPCTRRRRTRVEARRRVCSGSRTRPDRSPVLLQATRVVEPEPNLRAARARRQSVDRPPHENVALAPVRTHIGDQCLAAPVHLQRDILDIQVAELLTCARGDRERQCCERDERDGSGAAADRHSHSIVAGGFEERSRATRLTPTTSLTIRLEITSSTRRAAAPSPPSWRPPRLRRGSRPGTRTCASRPGRRPTGSREHGEALPEVAVEAGLADLLLEDRVSGPQDLEPLAR